jgi:hypothetical protein
MTSKKPPGNLRDFHVDPHASPSYRGLSESFPSSFTPAPPPPVATPKPALGLPPRQSVKPRTAGVREWTQTATPARAASAPPPAPGSRLVDSMSEDMWSSWEQETHATPAVATPASERKVASSRALVQSVPPSRASAPSVSLRAPLATRPPAPESASSEFAPDEEFSADAPNTGQARTDVPVGALPWSSELAHQERQMERTGTVDYTNQYQKHEILRTRTREFTAALQRLFRENVELFNESRRSGAHQIHVYRVNKTEEDFMLYRNGVKLIVSGSRAGRLCFAFNQYMGQIFAPTQTPIVEVEAVWGPFDQLVWNYKGERVQPVDIVRYFLTEFVRQSFR